MNCRRPATATGAAPIDQADQRSRRRKRLPVVYGGAFDLAAEVAEIAAPLADRVAGQPSPLAYLPDVEDLADAVSGAVRHVAVMVAESDARRRTAHVPAENRDRARRALVALAEVPADVEVTEAQVAAGNWPDVLTEHARPFAAPLAELLARAIPPGETRGALSISERVESELREIDSAATSLMKRIDRAESHREQNPRRSTRSTKADARATLAELGVTP